MSGVRDVGTRIEELLAFLRASAGPDVAPAAEDLVGLLVGLYGDGLAHIVAALDAEGEAGAAVLARMTADPLVESLLLLHDLHPLDVDTRIQRALDRVRPYLGSHAGGIEYLGVTEDGAARLRLEGNCHGCPSSTVTVQLAIQGAVEGAAPEVTGVVVEGVSEPPGPPGPPLLTIGSRPPDVRAEGSITAAREGRRHGAAGGSGPSGVRGSPPESTVSPRADTAAAREGHRHGAGDAGWVPLPGTGPPTGRPAVFMVDGTRADGAGSADGGAGTEGAGGATAVLVCSVRGTLYAYLDSCPACGRSLDGGVLDGARLACPGCAARYDVRSAGRGIDDPASHLDPLPLLSDSQGVRVALPVAVRS
jgi:Fe-S cluster biogenesis protein NfuA/nitrite reductase/ring-hydroxylating ferredoxin subunit